MEFIGIVLFLLASAIVSIVQKSAEKKKMQERAERRAQSARESMGEHIPTARRKGSAPRQASQTPEIEDVIRRLMGVDTDGTRAEESANDEGGWQPVAPPARKERPQYQQRPIRPSQPQAHRNPPAYPRQMHQPTRPPLEQPRQSQQPPPPPSARPTRQRPARTPAELVGQQRRRMAEDLTPEELERNAREKQWRQEMERRKKMQAAHEAAQRPRELPRQRPNMMQPRRGPFRGKGDLRRAIILSEVLNPPRALREIEDRI